MFCFLPVLLTALTLTPGQVEQDGVRIDVSIQAHVYTWTVTNVDAPPIMRFEVPTHGAYEQTVPEGWQWDLEDWRFRAWTTDSRRAIRPGQSKLFTAQVHAGGAALGAVGASIGVGFEDETVELADLWAPTPLRKSMVLLVVLMTAGIALLHTFLLERKRSRPGAV